MGLDPERADLGKVVVVEVGVDAEQASDDRLDRGAERLWEFLACTSTG